MLTYVCLGTNDLKRAVRFYDATLSALGLSRCDTSDESEWEGWVGWGTYEEHGQKEIALWLCQPFEAACNGWKWNDGCLASIHLEASPGLPRCRFVQRGEIGG